MEVLSCCVIVVGVKMLWVTHCFVDVPSMVIVFVVACICGKVVVVFVVNIPYIPSAVWNVLSPDSALSSCCSTIRSALFTGKPERPERFDFSFWKHWAPTPERYVTPESEKLLSISNSVVWDMPVRWLITDAL